MKHFMAGLHSNDSLRCLPACLFYFVRLPACLSFRLLVPRLMSSGLYVCQLSAGLCSYVYTIYINCLLVMCSVNCCIHMYM